MSIEDEMQVYDSTLVSRLTGETESYDNEFFPNIIRKREQELIEKIVSSESPKLILDYGCGGGWLSILLQKWGFKSVGIDISRNMVQNAKIVCPNADFIVCDAMRLPFKVDVFDFVIGKSVLHHLELKRATNELKRISLSQSVFLFMEPSLLNPLSAFGRRVFPMEGHTEGEKPYTPEYLRTSLILNNFTVEKLFSIFFFAYPAARFSKITKLGPPRSIVFLAYLLESFFEKMPGLRYLNANIVILARSSKK